MCNQMCSSCFYFHFLVLVVFKLCLQIGWVCWLQLAFDAVCIEKVITAFFNCDICYVGRFNVNLRGSNKSWNSEQNDFGIQPGICGIQRNFVGIFIVEKSSIIPSLRQEGCGHSKVGEICKKLVLKNIQKINGLMKNYCSFPPGLKKKHVEIWGYLSKNLWTMKIYSFWWGE